MRDEIIQKRNYDSAIQGDELSLKISSYPQTARYLAERLAPHGTSIVELCCGVGVSLVEFARRFESVTGVDSNLTVAAAARANVARAGATNCEVLVGSVDDTALLQQIDADIVAYDIPYWSDHGESLVGRNPDLKTTLELIRTHITSNIVVYTPPHITYDNIAAISDTFEFQEVWLDGKHDRNFVYFGNLVQSAEQSKVVFAQE